MNMHIEHCRLLIEVYVIEDVRTDMELTDEATARTFQRLTMEAMARIIEAHVAGRKIGGPDYVDGNRPGEAAGSRLHYWLERCGRVLRLVALRFDHLTRTDPFLADTDGLAYGPRTLIARHAVLDHRDGRRRRLVPLPVGYLDDARPPRPCPARPQLPEQRSRHRSQTLLNAVLKAFAAGWRQLWPEPPCHVPALAQLSRRGSPGSRAHSRRHG